MENNRQSMPTGNAPARSGGHPQGPRPQYGQPRPAQRTASPQGRAGAPYQQPPMPQQQAPTQYQQPPMPQQQATGQFQAMPMQYGNGQYGAPQYGFNNQPQPTPPAKKKMALWKKLLIAFGVIVVILAIGGAVGSNKGGTSNESKPAASSESKPAASSENKETPAQGQNETQQQAAQPEQPAKEPEKFTVANETLDTSNQFSAAITGVLTNNTDKDYGYVSVKYLLYDPDGNQIGSAVANITDLKAGGSWSFKAMALKPADQIGRYEFEGVTAF